MELKQRTKTRKEKNSKGITLIALVITIIVLLILAGVSIAMLTGENGILSQAAKAKEETEKAQANEAAILDEYNKFLNNAIGGTGSTTPPEEPENQGTLGTVTGDEETPTEVKDSLENKVVVPPGFTVQNPEDNVEDGIVIVDSDETRATYGSEFVWIPVGTIHTSSGDKTIELKRYVYKSDGTIDETLSKTEPTDQLKTSSTSPYTYTEGLRDSTTTNTHAKDIEGFKTSVEENGGYYLARYEARTVTKRTAKTDPLTQITTKPDEYVYNWVKQLQAAEQSQNMYTSEYFESDLVNSYAWDTAIVFLQECDDRVDKATPYSRQNSLNTGSLAEKGTNGTGTEDVICNVYDMASNCYEWSTETGSAVPCVFRGGHYYYSNLYTSIRGSGNTSLSDSSTSFRPLLYL